MQKLTTSETTPSRTIFIFKKGRNTLNTSKSSHRYAIDFTHLSSFCGPQREIHLQQLFRNLIENALKYRSGSTPQILISAQKSGCYWRFAIQDNGIGIDPEYQEKIFGLFKRLHGNNSYTGTGIGLAICQRVVNQYRARIWVESELGQGSTFFFTVRDNSREIQAGTAVIRGDLLGSSWAFWQPLKP